MTSDSNGVIEEQLGAGLQRIEAATDLDALTYVGPIAYGVEDGIKEALEDLRTRKGGLLVVLETQGGYIEIAERIAGTFRHHYGRVEFLIPDFAMSAGTVLAMSGDAIHMDYASVLGPIDPQVQTPASGDWVPALGYLEQYSRLVEKSRRGTLTTAELTFLVQNFDPAELYRYEQERELSIALLKDWLVRYKFKNWRTTRDRGKTVTPAMRTKRAGQIARALNKTGRWHSHSRGITMNVLREDLKLEVEDFGQNEELDGAIRAYHRLLRDYMMRRSHIMALHTHAGYNGA